MPPRALEFAILTAARTGEVLGAQWSEIDLAGAGLDDPRRAHEEEGGKEHRVPLSDAALRCSTRWPRSGLTNTCFPAAKGPLGQMAMRRVLAALGRGDISVHGFRSTFRDWAAETTAYPREVAEMALAHAVGNQVEAAYRRGDLFEKRRALMRDWARHCAGGAVVLPLPGRLSA